MSNALAVERVLVVDDDEYGSLPVRALLEERGVEVRYIDDARQVLRVLEEENLPDLIISDVMMPALDGFALCDLVRRNEAWRHLPLLFVTSLNDRSARLKALDAGGDDILSKPVDEAELIARVRSLGRLSRYRLMLEERDRLDQLMEINGDGVLILAADDTVTRANAAASQLLGMPEELPPTFPLVAHIETRFSVERDLRSRALLELAARRGSGRRFVEWKARRVAGSDSSTTVVTVRDVTESVLRTRASAALLDTISHKFNTPLAAVQAGVELLGDSPRLTDEDRELLELVDGGALRLKASIDRVIQFVAAGSSAAISPLGLDRASLEDVLAEQAGPETKLGRFDVDGATQVDGRVLSLALEELVANALAAGAESISVDVETDAEEMMVSVVDDGSGFPSNDATRIFESFYQVDPTGEHDGMGIGLALVRYTVTEAGGRCGATSPVGEPTRVWFTLPALGGALR